MKLYVLVNYNDKICGDRAYLSYNKAKQSRDEYEECEGRNYDVKEIELHDSFIGRYVYSITLYKGFDYETESMHDVSSTSNILYSCKDSAKTSKWWKEYLDIALQSPENHHIHDDFICSDDDGSDWYYGDVMEGKFNLHFNKLRVKKAQ